MLKICQDFDLRKKRVLMRVDFNVPLDTNGQVANDFKIRAHLPSINYCLKSGAAVTLMSHLGRPKGKVSPKDSLMPLRKALAELLKRPITFSHNCISMAAQKTSRKLKPGQVHLLENLRFYPGETANDSSFSASLAKHGEIYINDAFGTAHREHASNIGITSYFQDKGIGLLMQRELHFLREAIKDPARPLVLVLGGQKINTKIDLLRRFVNKADMVLIGGAMAFTFLKAMKVGVGQSFVEPDKIKIADEIIQRYQASTTDLVFPLDLVCAKSICNGLKRRIVGINEIPKLSMGLDMGPETIIFFSRIIRSAGTIIWNGPMGVFEKEDFRAGTLGITKSIATATMNGATSIVGGGETAAAVCLFGLEGEMTHVSTGGGASLELLSGKKLPAIEILKK